MTSRLRQLALAAVILAPTCAAAAEETLLHVFTEGKNGKYDAAQPQSGLVADSAGNLFGATQFGGQHGYGTIYELHRRDDGSYRYELIYSLGGADRLAFPQGRVTVGLDGHLYLTAAMDSVVGAGGVLELVPDGKTGWKLGRSVLFNGDNGASPFAGLAVDPTGKLFGVARIGGSTGTGTVFQVDTSGAELVITAIYNFQGARDGANPETELLADKAGNLFGISQESGGEYDYGGIFQMRHDGGKWTFHIILETPRYNYFNTFAPLVEDSAGNLYGMAGTALPHWWNGQLYQEIFRLSPPAKGEMWKYKPVMAQPLLTKNQKFDVGGLQGIVFDAAGHGYVTIGAGGKPRHMGEIVELTPTQTGLWSRQVLYTFDGGRGGAGPSGPLVLDTEGRLLGYTEQGGSGRNLNGKGVLFSLTP